jgi:hypothetical protein
MSAFQPILQNIYRVDGLIDLTPQGAERPVFPRRDRRKRPALWLERDAFAWLRAEGALEEVTRGYVLSQSTVRRLRHGREGALGQHEALQERNIYISGGSIRPAHVNTRITALDRLARRRFLSKAEYEAGQALARDYARAGHGQIATQDFMASGADGGDRAGAAERAMLNRVTASTRLTAARVAMGEGLAGPVIAVCCRDERIDEVERAERWAKGAGRNLIKVGLGCLVKLYGTQPGQSAQ